MLPDETQKRLGSKESPNKAEALTIGLDEDKFKTALDIDLKKMFSGGLLEVKPDKLVDQGIDPFNLINR